MRYPDNPPHDRPGQNDVGDRPVTDTTTSEARGTSGTPTTSEAPATLRLRQPRKLRPPRLQLRPPLRLQPRPKPTTSPWSATGATSWIARKRPSAE